MGQGYRKETQNRQKYVRSETTYWTSGEICAMNRAWIRSLSLANCQRPRFLVAIIRSSSGHPVMPHDIPHNKSLTQNP
jgi:hypothetical protein